MSARSFTAASDLSAASAATQLPCREPGSGEVLGSIPVDDPARVREIIAEAREAQAVWSRTTLRQRAALLQQLLDAVLAQADAIVDDVVRDAGKTREHALLGEIWPVCERLRWTIKRGPDALADESVSGGMLVHKKATIEFHPLGVVGAIIPWNYPFQNIMNPLIPALMAGNAVVIKPSEWVAWSSQRILGRIHAVLAKAGYPKALVSMVQGFGPTGQALVEGGVDQVVFIGSATNGRRVIASSAKHAIPVIMELGGKDPLIVCDDADLDRAHHATLAGVFINAGQNCLAAERLVVFDHVYDAYTQRLVDTVSALRQGDPVAAEPGSLDVGAIVSPIQLSLIDALVKEAIAAGGILRCGGVTRDAEDGTGGQFFAPTVLEVTPDNPIMHKEVFGPVAVVCRVKDEAQAITVANSTEFALGCNIITRSAARAKRMGRAIVSGGVCVNDFGLTYMAQELPFGGVKGSGFGRLNGVGGLRAMTNQKAVLTDRVTRWGAPSKLFPVAPGDYEAAKATMAMLYANGLSKRLEGAVALARQLLKRRGQ